MPAKDCSDRVNTLRTASGWRTASPDNADSAQPLPGALRWLGARYKVTIAASGSSPAASCAQRATER